MTDLQIGGWHLHCDVEATRAAYETAQGIGPESCSCDYCKNYIAARAGTYATPVAEFFAQFGIDPPREVETYELGPEEGGRLYGGWAHIVGGIVDAPPQETGRLLVTAAGDPRCFEVTFHERANLVASSFRDLPVVQLEFTLIVPWVLQSPTPD